jgi:hypothetical protein
MSERSESVIEYASVVAVPPRQPWRFVVVLVMCLVMAWIVGSATNAVSGTVSLRYFDDIVGWMYPRPITLSSVVRQGFLEASFFGIGFATLFITVYAASTGTRCPFSIVARSLGLAMLITLGCWILGGIAAATWASVSPIGFAQAFPMSATISPESQFVRWAAVGGSIWGVEAGGIIGLLVASIWLHFRWRRELQGP